MNDQVNTDLQFTTREVSAIVGCKPAHLRMWIHRGHLKLRAAGQGKPRLFSSHEMLRVAIAVELINRLGVSCRVAFKFSEEAARLYSAGHWVFVGRVEDDGSLNIGALDCVTSLDIILSGSPIIYFDLRALLNCITTETIAILEEMARHEDP